MRRWDPLNDRQLQPLRRIAALEDLSGPEHGPLCLSGDALRDRGLVTISRRGGTWAATITPAGESYLRHGHHGSRR